MSCPLPKSIFIGNKQVITQKGVYLKPNSSDSILKLDERPSIDKKKNQTIQLHFIVHESLNRHLHVVFCLDILCSFKDFNNCPGSLVLLKWAITFNIWPPKEDIMFHWPRPLDFCVRYTPSPKTFLHPPTFCLLYPSLANPLKFFFATLPSHILSFSPQSLASPYNFFAPLRYFLVWSIPPLPQIFFATPPLYIYASLSPHFFCLPAVFDDPLHFRTLLSEPPPPTSPTKFSQPFWWFTSDWVGVFCLEFLVTLHVCICM